MSLSASSPIPRPGTGRGWIWSLDLACLALAALLARAPFLMSVPQFTDEAREVMWALRIFWGQHLPLAGHNGYAGPLWSYLLAAVMWLVGPSLALPRALVMTLGCLTVLATYAFARLMAGRAAGWTAGLLAAVSFVPVYVNSHVAWSACTVPFFATCALASAQVAVQRGSGRWLVTAAVLVALTTQAHPLGVLLATPILGWALTQAAGRRLARTRWAGLALGAGLVAYGNMLVFHAASGFRTVGVALQKLADGVPSEFSLGAYLATSRALAANLVDLLTAQAHRPPFGAAGVPLAFEAVVLLVIGSLLAVAARRGAALPLWVVVVTVVVMPLFNTNYTFPLGARYLAFLLPVIYAGVGAAAAAAIEGLAGRGPVARRGAPALVALVVLCHAALHADQLADEYRKAAASGRTNAAALALVQDVRVEWERSGAPVLLSERIDAKNPGGGHLHRVLAMLLGLAEVPFAAVPDDAEALPERVAVCRPRCVAILAEHHQAQLGARYRLEPWPEGQRPESSTGEGYGVFWLGAR